jgi:alpha-amylase
LKERFGSEVLGMWVPERVWEQSLARDLVQAGVEYTFLDDSHFKSAGLIQDELYGYYVTEDEGKLLKIFPGSERLRYLIPFASPEETIETLGGIAARHPDAIVAFADDGEKFGVWPETRKHVYDDGWLRRFFDLLVENQSWIRTTTPTEALQNVAPMGKVFIPEGSYREMTEWSLPAERILAYEHARHELEHTSAWECIAPLIRGGFWRNFKRKYPESDEMYSRMLMVSQRLERASRGGADAELIRRAQSELYRGQCNCSYWHGAFGGIYLPHLRGAVYQHLIAADNLLEEARGRCVGDGDEGWVEAVSGDFNLDTRPEIKLSSDKFVALVAPAPGGQLYELDVRSICHNLLATLARRPEGYHARVLAGDRDNQDDLASIHDRVVFKQEGLAEQLQFDSYPRKSLLDHFYDPSVTLADVASGQAVEQGDFLTGKYSAQLRRKQQRVQVLLAREGQACGHRITLTKGITLEAGSHVLQFAYRLEGLPPHEPLHFAVELNFAGLPAAAEHRYFYGGQRINLGDLGTKLDLRDVQNLGLVDEWLGVDVALAINRPTGIWTYPIASVNQSEAGFELVHQSVVVLPHWIVRGDVQGRWSVEINLEVGTSLAESRTLDARTAAL